MKYLKLFESQNIEDICSKYGIRNYHINEDGTVDVDGSVNLFGKKLDKIPINFGNVTGVFWCHDNNLRNLIGSPKRVGRNFVCGGNINLTSLEGCPTYIGWSFYCHSNTNLWSMDHFPRHAKEVYLGGTPILPVFNLFRAVYLGDGGKYFSTSWSLMDFFEHCDPVWPGKIIKKKRLENFLSSIDKKLRPEDIEALEKLGWKIED